MDYDIPVETDMTVPQIIEMHGYGCETLTVTTTDGFQLSIFRIYCHDVDEHGPAVLLQHGLLADAANWVSILGVKLSANIFVAIIEHVSIFTR